MNSGRLGRSTRVSWLPGCHGGYLHEPSWTGGVGWACPALLARPPARLQVLLFYAKASCGAAACPARSSAGWPHLWQAW
eukprot:7230695-Alexandrium_andersonii.AAC.1